MALKEAYTTKELMPLLELSFASSIIRRAKREKWQNQERAGRGGGKEWLVSSMPEETQLAIRAAEEKQALGEEKSLPQKQLSSVTTPAILDDKKRYKALARADLLGSTLYGSAKTVQPRHRKRHLWKPTVPECGRSCWRKSVLYPGRLWNAGR